MTVTYPGGLAAVLLHLTCIEKDKVQLLIYMRWHKNMVEIYKLSGMLLSVPFVSYGRCETFQFILKFIQTIELRYRSRTIFHLCEHGSTKKLKSTQNTTSFVRGSYTT